MPNPAYAAVANEPANDPAPAYVPQAPAMGGAAFYGRQGTGGRGWGIGEPRWIDRGRYSGYKIVMGDIPGRYDSRHAVFSVVDHGFWVYGVEPGLSMA